MKTIPCQFRWLWLVALALALGGAGCSSTPKQAAGFHASVQVDGRARPEIQQAVEKVFREHGYEVVRTTPELVFDKPAGTMKTLAYGSLGGKNVFSRAKVTIKNDGAGGFIIGCNAYVVRDRGDSFFEEEQKLIRFKGGDYQDLLDEVKQRLLK